MEDEETVDMSAREDTIEETVEEIDLDAVFGGMQWQDFRRSTNVEYARGSNSRPNTSPGSLPNQSNSPLARQLGIGSIGKSR